MEVTPFITPQDTCLSPFVFLPSDDAEILCFELYTGRLVRRLKGMERNASGRVTCVAGRTAHHVVFYEMFSNNRNCIPEQ